MLGQVLEFMTDDKLIQAYPIIVVVVLLWLINQSKSTSTTIYKVFKRYMKSIALAGVLYVVVLFGLPYVVDYLPVFDIVMARNAMSYMFMLYLGYQGFSFFAKTGKSWQMLWVIIPFTLSFVAKLWES